MDQYIQQVQLLRDKVPSFDEYPFSLPAVAKLDKITFHPAVTFLVGENGAGKPTLLEAIAVAWGFNAEGGSHNFRFSTRASHSSLSDHLRLVKGIRRPKDDFFLRAESFFNVATEIERLLSVTYLPDRLPVARMQALYPFRGAGIRGKAAVLPDSASLHPGYAVSCDYVNINR